MDLTEEQWNIVKKFLPEDPKRADGRGRPWSDQRQCLNGILWILRTGALEGFGDGSGINYMTFSP